VRGKISLRGKISQDLALHGRTSPYLPVPPRRARQYFPPPCAARPSGPPRTSRTSRLARQDLSVPPALRGRTSQDLPGPPRTSRLARQDLLYTSRPARHDLPEPPIPGLRNACMRTSVRVRVRVRMHGCSRKWVGGWVCVCEGVCGCVCARAHVLVWVSVRARITHSGLVGGLVGVRRIAGRSVWHHASVLFCADQWADASCGECLPFPSALWPDVVGTKP
jgi:hypothetical protein